MPSILSHCPVRQFLACILFCSILPAFYTGLSASPWPRYNTSFRNDHGEPDTVIPACVKEWEKYRKRIWKKENRLKDPTYKMILLAVLNNLDSLKNSIQKYAIGHVDTGTGQTTYDMVSDVIIFNIQKNNTANFVHESTHGREFERGEIVYRDTLVPGWPKIVGGIGDDFEDEIEAYRAQFVYDPGSVRGLKNLLKSAEHLEDIDPPWLINLVDDSGKRIYEPNGKDGVTRYHTNIYSTGKDMINAYPKANIGTNEDYILGRDPHYLNFPAKLERYRLTLRSVHDSLTRTSSPHRSQ